MLIKIIMIIIIIIIIIIIDMEWHGAMAVAFKALTTGTGKVTKRKSQ